MQELADPDSDGPGANAGSPERTGGKDESEIQREERDGLQRERRGGYAGDECSEMGHTKGDNERREWEFLEGRQQVGRSGAEVGNPKSLRQREQADEADALPKEGRTWDKFGGTSNRWPARPGQVQLEWEAPRTIESGMGCTIDGYNFREDLLRALGNSVIEQQAEYAFRDLIRKHLNQR